MYQTQANHYMRDSCTILRNLGKSLSAKFSALCSAAPLLCGTLHNLVETITRFVCWCCSLRISSIVFSDSAPSHNHFRIDSFKLFVGVALYVDKCSFVCPKYPTFRFFRLVSEMPSNVLRRCCSKERLVSCGVCRNTILGHCRPFCGSCPLKTTKVCLVVKRCMQNLPPYEEDAQLVKRLFLKETSRLSRLPDGH